MVFLDANVLIYYLDETSEKNKNTIRLLQKLVDEQEQLATSHHVIEEVLFIISRIQSDISLLKVVQRIGEIPNIILVEPSPNLLFAERYAGLSDGLKMGINDALLLQLIVDAGITSLFSYDKQLVSKAAKLGIDSVVNLPKF
jgi:predicted nucleic acid-binding protein